MSALETVHRRYGNGISNKIDERGIEVAEAFKRAA